MTDVGLSALAVLPTGVVSRFADHWTADECSLRAIGVRGISEELGTLTRDATASVLDSNGVARTVGRHRPAWEVMDWNADGVREQPTLLLGATDVLFWSYYGLPQAMTIYLAFVENGAKAIANAGLLHIGLGDNTGARLQIDATGTFYRARHHNGTTESTSTLGTAPSTNDKVEMLLQLASGGNVTLSQRINFGAWVAAAQGGAASLLTAWSYPRVYMGSRGDTNPGNTKFKCRRIAFGVRTAAEMGVGW